MYTLYTSWKVGGLIIMGEIRIFGPGPNATQKYYDFWYAQELKAELATIKIGEMALHGQLTLFEEK